MNCTEYPTSPFIIIISNSLPRQLDIYDYNLMEKL